MFQVRSPFHVFVPATVTNSTLVFDPGLHLTLIRYQIFPGRRDVVPELMPAPPWSLCGAPALLASAGVLTLQFDGSAMNALVASDDEDETYLAFLDQRATRMRS